MTPPVAGIGASAGGLEAFKLLLRHLPPDTGLAFVFVQHLDPKHHSNLAEILAKGSPIPVQQASDGMEIEPNHLYVIPPDAALEIGGPALRVTQRARTAAGPHMPIDRFLRSLAQECGSRSIGIILSGAGTDGAAGLEAVKEAGGVTFVQDPATAKFVGMPQAARDRGDVDFVLSPEGIAAELPTLSHHPYIAEDEDTGLGLPATVQDQFGAILTLLHEGTGVDFASYRESTVRRRILRRLALRNIASLKEYRAQLENDPHELSALHRDLLISVTCFFRDPESFENLKKLVFPRLVQQRAEKAAIRIWVPGCATGEEAYSIAISLEEYFQATGRGHSVQIFATDISSAALEKARIGKYSGTIAVDVSPERLNRHFWKVEGGYQVNKKLREMCIFSRHDLIQDPPFSKLDLISCRNVLMFFGTARKNVITLFHYALKPGGFLVLGASEAEVGNLFSIVEGGRSFYTKNDTVGKRHPAYGAAVRPGRSTDSYKRVEELPASELAQGIDLRKELERCLLSKYGAAAVVVDENMEVVETLGQTAPYLTVPEGKASLNLLKLIPETRVFLEVEKLCREVKGSRQAARQERIPYQADGAIGEVNVEVTPLGDSSRLALLVLFEPSSSGSELQQVPDTDPRDRQIRILKQDLADARHRILSIIDEHQLGDEQSQDAAEDALSANEELQSLNEELETAKEELQSINEELTTVNQELLSNNAALMEARDFAMSVIETASAPLLVLDTDLRIKAANPAFRRVFHISAGDAEGRFLYTIGNGFWNLPRLREVLQRILPENKAVHDFEVHTDFPGFRHRVFLLNARQLDGLQQILLGIDDITERKELDLKLAAIVESSDDAIVSKTLDGTVDSWNSGAERIYGYAAHEMIGRPISILTPPGYEGEMTRIIERLQRGEKVNHFETKRLRKDGEIIDVSVSISPIQGRDGVATGAAIVARDITELKRRQLEDLAKQKLESVGTLAGGIAHDFNNLLGGVLAHAELALGELSSGALPERELEGIRSLAIRGSEIVGQLMIYAGQESETLELVDVSGIVEDMLALLKVSVSKHAVVEINLGRNLPPVRANPAQIRQVAMNLITNASEAIGDRDGVIRVTTRLQTVYSDTPAVASEELAQGDYVRLEVSDTGRGMTAETQARVFDPFFTTKLAGHGLGLAVVQGIVRSIGGAIRIVSAPGKGTAVQILLPCAEHQEKEKSSTDLPACKETTGVREATILVVEDEDLLREAILKMLRKVGFMTLEASNGSSALDVIRTCKDPIDLLLLDITLPGTSSREVFEEAKRLRPHMRVIASSAYSEETANTWLAGRFQRFIRKPYRLDQLTDSIRAVLSC